MNQIIVIAFIFSHVVSQGQVDTLSYHYDDTVVVSRVVQGLPIAKGHKCRNLTEDERRLIDSMQLLYNQLDGLRMRSSESECLFQMFVGYEYHRFPIVINSIAKDLFKYDLRPWHSGLLMPGEAYTYSPVGYETRFASYVGYEIIKNQLYQCDYFSGYSDKILELPDSRYYILMNSVFSAHKDLVKYELSLATQHCRIDNLKEVLRALDYYKEPSSDIRNYIKSNIEEK